MRQLLTPETAPAQAALTASTRLKAAEVAEKFPGWHVWAARNGTPVATRAGSQEFIDDGVFAKTIIADDWAQLEAELAEQARHDEMRA